MKLGMICRMDDTGLGNQTRDLAYMLKPDKILLIDSTSFNKNKQHPEWYENFNVHIIKGFPTNLDCSRFLNGLTHMLTAETVYNLKMYNSARLKRVKTFNQTNWEFCDSIKNRNLPRPDVWLMPSYWHLDDMRALYPSTTYLPPPIFLNNFKKARNTNLDRKGPRRFVHIIGKQAIHDRNGTLDLIDSLKHTDGDFELVIRSQNEVPDLLPLLKDNRIKIQISNVEDQQELYNDFDAMILPRRYGGLCLPMNEALACGLPVIMTDINPNSEVLPKEWLVPASVIGNFMARTSIDIYKSDVMALGKKLEIFADMGKKELNSHKTKALDIAMNNYSHEVLRDKYEKIMGL